MGTNLLDLAVRHLRRFLPLEDPLVAHHRRTHHRAVRLLRWSKIALTSCLATGGRRAAYLSCAALSFA